MNRTLKIFVFSLLAILLSSPVFATPDSDGVSATNQKELDDYGAELNSFKEDDQQQPPPAENAPQTQGGGSGDTVAEAPGQAEPAAVDDESSEATDESEESADESEDSTDDDVGSDDEDSTDDDLGSDDEDDESGGEDE